MLLLKVILPVAQTALTAFLVIYGLLLVIFVELPTTWCAGGDSLSGDWKPTILAVALIARFVIVNILPKTCMPFALTPLGWIEAGSIAGAVAIWLPLVRLFYRRRLIARFLGLRRLFTQDGLN